MGKGSASTSTSSLSTTTSTIQAPQEPSIARQLGTSLSKIFVKPEAPSSNPLIVMYERFIGKKTFQGDRADQLRDFKQVARGAFFFQKSLSISYITPNANTIKEIPYYNSNSFTARAIKGHQIYLSAREELMALDDLRLKEVAQEFVTYLNELSDSIDNNTSHLSVDDLPQHQELLRDIGYNSIMKPKPFVSSYAGSKISAKGL